jgi:predicted ATPase/DNA-binding winged helix-turn-helix (wHTH) protein
VPEQALTFGPFELLPEQRVLLGDGKPVRVGSRALDILILLTARAGELVTKEELNARIWPDTFVEEANIRVHVAALRKALADGQSGSRYVMTVPGRGYSFVAQVTRAQERRAAVAQLAATGRTHNLPTLLTRMIGRTGAVRAIGERLPERRFVTVVGPGGMGKTTIAIAVAETLLDSYAHGACFVNLASLADPRLVPSALGSVLGLSMLAENPLPGLSAYLHDKQMLIVLDNCEHVIEAAATLAEEVLRAAPGVHILATSREPLRAEGEWVQRLPSLEIPPASDRLAAAEALAFPAIQLFVERATASLETFILLDDDAPTVVDICRRLDGIPLAIELAAARVELFGVRGLAGQINDRFSLLTKGRRTAVPRHQTLKATLDWSYDILSPSEQQVLRRLAVFAGGFDLEAASAVVADGATADSDVLEGVTSLAAKSLLAVDIDGDAILYKLLELTRTYAIGKLADSSDLQSTARRHAGYYRGLLEKAEAEWQTRPTVEWLAAYGPQIDNVRAALDWAFSANADVEIGVALTAAAVPLWMHLSLVSECRTCVARALDRIHDLLAESRSDARLEMRLLAALGLSLIYTQGRGAEIHSALARALEIAERLDDTDYRLRCLWGLFVGRFNEGEFLAAEELARRFRGVAGKSPDPYDTRVGDRLLGFALHFLGDQPKARQHIERMLAGYVVPDRRSHLVRFQYDQRVAARVPLAAILWLQGYPDQAMQAAVAAVDDGRSMDHALSLGYALSTAACPTALLVGDLAAADRFVTMLLDHSARYSFGPWSSWGRYFASRLVLLNGDASGGLQGMTAALHELRTTGFGLRYTAYLGEIAEALGSAGRIAKPSRPSTRRWRAGSARRNAGVLRSSCA